MKHLIFLLLPVLSFAQEGVPNNTPTRFTENIYMEDTVRVTGILGAGNVNPQSRVHFRRNANGFSSFFSWGDSSLQYSIYDSSNDLQLLVTSYNGLIELKYDSTGTGSDRRVFIDAHGISLDDQSAVAGYIPVAQNTDGLIAWQASPSSWLTIVEQSTSTTGVAGSYYYYDVTADSDTLTLPGSPADNDLIGVYLQTTSSSNTVLIARNGSTIGGLTQDVTLFINNDNIILQHINGNWIIVSNGIQIHYTTLERAAAQTISGFTTIDFDTEVNDIGGIGDIANNRIIPRRTGNYQIDITNSFDFEANGNMNCYIRKNGVALREYDRHSTGASSNSIPLSTVEQLTSTDTITVVIFENFVANPSSKTDDRRVRINFYEIP